MNSTAALAFCNDIDFADWSTYREAHRVLWECFGIDAEDSFWLFDPAGSEMALFKSSLSEKGTYHDEILEEVRAGRLAILHGAGNFDRLTTDLRPSRGLIGEGLAYLHEHACIPPIWSNHGDEGNIQNIGWPGAGYQQGDDPASECYVLDLLLQHGVRFFWTDRHCTNSFVCGRGSAGEQALIRLEMTRSGTPIHCFIRYRGALPKAPDAQTLGLQLTEEHLQSLIDQGGATVIYQHWCVHRDAERRPFTAGRPVFPLESMNALRRLADARDKGLLRIQRCAALLAECSQASAKEAA